MVFVDTDLAINYLRRRPKPVVIKAQAALKELFEQHGEVKLTLFTLTIILGKLGQRAKGLPSGSLEETRG